MKGAKGLLISITGGRDLTLYEVDEAATRIREEIDQDANIIVGATFDETLDGIIRVSVVATGIDKVAAQRSPATVAESRITEIAQRLRADNARIAERIERAEAVQSQQPQPASPLKPAAASATMNASIESVAKAAIAAAVDDVSIRPLALKPSLFLGPAASGPAAAPEPKEFIPPQAERMPRAPRMPRVDELPVPAQNEIRARRGELRQDDHPGKRKSLLERLASVGLGRRDAKDEEVPVPRQVRQAPPQPGERIAGRAKQRPTEPRHEPVSEYAKRSAPLGLDQHGRQTPVHKSGAEEELEIPAFLRRQAH
jgi:cell division protein FtsZ